MLNYNLDSVSFQKELPERPVKVKGADGREYSADWFITSGTYASLLEKAFPDVAFRR